MPRARPPSPSKENETPGTGDLEGRILRAAHAAGVRVTVDGEDLILVASAEPPSAVLVQLLQHKAGIIRILRPPSHCYGCREVERAGEPLLPFGIEDTGHAWLHSCCWPDWYAARKAEVMGASTAMGISRAPLGEVTNPEADMGTNTHMYGNGERPPPPSNGERSSV